VNYQNWIRIWKRGLIFSPPRPLEIGFRNSGLLVQLSRGQFSWGQLSGWQLSGGGGICPGAVVWGPGSNCPRSRSPDIYGPSELKVFHWLWITKLSAKLTNPTSHYRYCIQYSCTHIPTIELSTTSTCLDKNRHADFWLVGCGSVISVTSPTALKISCPEKIMSQGTYI
jgi:hypothetical protein